jgi:hypothetical protein
METQKKYQCLSGSMLKLLAVVTMIIDHSASLISEDHDIIFSFLCFRDIYLYNVMRSIGRIAFPLFAFLLVEGFEHTRDRKKYGIRLFVFALLSEIPWDLEHTLKIFNPDSQNVFFTLFLGYLGICVLKRMEEKMDWKNILSLFGLLTASFVLRADYSYIGFGFILILWLLRNLPVPRAVVGITFLNPPLKAGLAFLPIFLYNGKRGFITGKALQFLFYAIYPLHMLVLFALKKYWGLI